MITKVEKLAPFASEGRGATSLWKDVAKVVNDTFGGNVNHVGSKDDLIY